jgi:hypothetical protein
MSANTIFREITELLGGVHGQLSDAKIIERVTDLIAQAHTEMSTADWLLAHERWRSERWLRHDTNASGTQEEAVERRKRRVGRKWADVYKTEAMESRLAVEPDGSIVLYTTGYLPEIAIRPFDNRIEVIDMGVVERLAEQHGKPLVEWVMAELKAKAA